MMVCIDSGNTRIKWGVHDGLNWCEQGALDHAEVGALADLCRRWPSPDRVMLANVAGPLAAEAIARVLAPWSVSLTVVKSTANGGGVTNLYENPEQLGVDRWCALVGARSLGRMPCLVVMAGTATTIDSLDANGNFLGGLILPGFDLMRGVLARQTASLPFAVGSHVSHPRRTDDAIATGCIEAQVGAIERAYGRLNDAKAICLLSGGNASVLGNHLVIEHALAHNLPLEGMRQLAFES